eukprot:953505_1
MRINTERESQRASIARTNTARAARAQIEQAKHEKEQFRKQAAQEKQKRIKTEREYEEKQRVDDIVSFVWQWQDEQNHWQSYDDETSKMIGALRLHGNFSPRKANADQHRKRKPKS